MKKENNLNVYNPKEQEKELKKGTKFIIKYFNL